MSDPWWDWGVWAFRASVAQANGAGGAIIVDFEPAPGETMIIMRCHAINSGTNGLKMSAFDEDNNENPLFLFISSAATTEGGLPRVSPSGSTDTGIVGTEPWETRLFRGDDFFSIAQTGAGAQNDTLIIVLRAMISGLIPTISKARSTNQGDVTITETENKVL